MLHRRRSYRIFSIVALALLGAAAPASAQTLVVTAKSLNDLADDFEYLLNSVAPEGDPRAQQVRDAINQFKGGELVKGLDQGRPFGVAVSLPRDFPQGGGPSIVAAVPVKDLGQFLDSLKGMGVDVSDKPDAPGFSHKVTTPDGNMGLFVLESKGYGIFSLTPDDPDKLKAVDPASWRPKGRPESTVSYRVKLSEIPDALKEQILGGAEAQLQQQNERKPGEKDAEYKGRMAAQNYVLDGFKSLVKDGDTLELDLDVSKEAQAMALELSLSGRPGTDLAKTLRTFGGQRSRFEGLGADAAVAAWARFPVAKVFQAGMKAGLDEAVEKGRKDVKTEEQKKLYDRLAELVRANLDVPEMDLGLSIQKDPSAGQGDQRLVMVGGLRVRNGQEFEKLARDAAAQIKPEGNVKVTFDVATAADGTAIHQVTGPIDKEKDADLAKHFGKATLYFAIRPDVVMASFGESGLPALQRAMERASAPAGSSDGPVAAVVHVANVGPFAEKKQEAFRRITGEVFRGDAAKHDRVALTLKGGGDGVRLRLTLDVPALKVMARLGNEANK